MTYSHLPPFICLPSGVLIQDTSNASRSNTCRIITTSHIMSSTDLRDAATFDLEAQLERLSLDSDVYKGYIEGIMDDEDGGDLEERVDSVLAFLGSATEEDLGGFGTELKKQYEVRHAAEAARAASVIDADKAEERRRYEERLEQDKRAAQAEQERQAADLIERTQGDRATARGREALLNKYAFGDDVVDEDGNPVGKPSNGKDGSNSKGEADVVLGALLGENSNKKQVEAAARALREKSKAEHEKKVIREKVRTSCVWIKWRFSKQWWYYFVAHVVSP